MAHHLLGATGQDKMATVGTLARSRYVDLLEITNDDNPNPYDNLLNDA